MKKLAKTINLKALPGTTESSVITKLLDVETQGRGQQMQYMRKWLQGGYILGELGHGLLESLIAIDGAGLLDGMQQSEKADFLIDLLQRTRWREPVTQEKDSPVVSVPVAKDPVEQTTVGPENTRPKSGKKRKNIDLQVG